MRQGMSKLFCTIMGLALVFLFSGCASNGDSPGQSLQGGAIQGDALSLSTATSTFAGTVGIHPWPPVDGTGAAASFYEPYGITTDGTNLYIAEKSSRYIRKIVISTKAVTTLVSVGFSEPTGITTDGTNLYVCDRSADSIQKIKLSDNTMTRLAGGTSGTLDGTGVAAQFNEPYGITTDGTNLYVADRNNHTIRKIVISTGVVTTIAGQAGVPGFANGIGLAATFNQPMSITTDGINLYVGDWNNFTIRKVVIATGAVSTLAGTVGVPGDDNGIGTAATFYGPRGITTDGTNLYVADMHGGQPHPTVVPGPPEFAGLIRKINISTGAVTIVAGIPESSGSADNPSGALATFNQPSGITTDGTSLFVTDREGHTIRQIQ